MNLQNNQPPRTMRDIIASICGWLSAGFAGLFLLAVGLFLAGFVDLREGGELGFAAIILTVPPALFFGAIWLILRVTRTIAEKPNEPLQRTPSA